MKYGNDFSEIRFHRAGIKESGEDRGRGTMHRAHRYPEKKKNRFPLPRE